MSLKQFCKLFQIGAGRHFRPHLISNKIRRLVDNTGAFIITVPVY